MAKAKTQAPVKQTGTLAKAWSYSDEIAAKILTRIANGESLRRICRDPDMPDRVTVARWCGEDAAFASKYARARDLQADHMADEMQEVAETCEDVNRGRLIVQTLQWRASKLAPKKYGDKLDIEHSGAVELDATKVLGELGGLLDAAMKLEGV